MGLDLAQIRIQDVGGIGVDTNVLARYYMDEDTDGEATRQREAAQRLSESGNALLVSKTVLLELDCHR